MTAPRSTSTPTVRTAAATAARRRARAARLAHELACRLDELDDEHVAVLAWLLAAEVKRRGLVAR